MFASAITIGELANGVALLPTGARRQYFATSLIEIERRFSAHILPVDIDVARRWGELSAAAQASGVQMSVTDGLIAATALHHGLHVMTHNRRHFATSGVMIIDPWQD